MNPKHLIQLSWQLPVLLLSGLALVPDVPMQHPHWGFWPLWLLALALGAGLVGRRYRLAALPARIQAGQVLDLHRLRVRQGPAPVAVRRAA
jgi:hypothetical protein